MSDLVLMTCPTHHLYVLEGMWHKDDSEALSIFMFLSPSFVAICNFQ